MERFDIECQNDDCNVQFEYTCESESSGDGAQHVAKCPACGKGTYFEVAVVATADHATFALDEGL